MDGVMYGFTIGHSMGSEIVVYEWAFCGLLSGYLDGLQ